MIYNKLLADVTEYSPNSQLPTPNSFLLINEATLKRQYKYKNNSSEHIVASRTSGFRHYQQLAFLPSMVQFFHFYHDILEWKTPTKFFLNPVSPGSTSKYFFLLRDTIVSGIDSTFIISYQPCRSTNFEGLKGLLYINTNGWAIQNVVAEPADYSPVHLKIQQSYALIDSAWFPTKLSLDLIFENISNTGLNVIFRGKSHITDVDLSPDLTDKSIKGRNITIADNANKKKGIIDLYRNTELSQQEDSILTSFIN